jgi:flagellar basal body-associated protein FliL
MATSPKPVKPVVKAVETVEVPQKSRKTLIIAIAAGVLVLIVAGAVAAFLFMSRAKPPGAESHNAASQEAAKTPTFVNI